MSRTIAHHSNAVSKLHRLLKGCCTLGVKCPIDLSERFSEMKKKAEADWLKGLEKNGYEHSERLERYLCDLLKKRMGKKNPLLTPAEVFVLLCATYMHDVGYLKDGKLDARGHPEKSRDYLLSDPKKYLLHDFPPFKENHPRVVEAIGWVALGHSEERFVPLKAVPSDFADQALSDTPRNLRKLAALLRLADEADDPYIRPKGASAPSMRDKTPLVRIGTETIAWHWGCAGVRESKQWNQVYFLSILALVLRTRLIEVKCDPR